MGDWACKWIDGWVDGWTDGWTDGLGVQGKGGWEEGQVKVCIVWICV